MPEGLGECAETMYCSLSTSFERCQYWLMLNWPGWFDVLELL